LSWEKKKKKKKKKNRQICDAKLMFNNVHRYAKLLCINKLGCVLILEKSSCY